MNTARCERRLAAGVTRAGWAGAEFEWAIWATAAAAAQLKLRLRKYCLPRSAPSTPASCKFPAKPTRLFPAELPRDPELKRRVLPPCRGTSCGAGGVRRPRLMNGHRLANGFWILILSCVWKSVSFEWRKTAEQRVSATAEGSAGSGLAQRSEGKGVWIAAPAPRWCRCCLGTRGHGA